MKKCVLLFCFLFLLDSCTSYDFLNDSVSVDSTFPSILFVQVESPSYKGYAMITDILLRYYYSKYDTSIHNMFEERIYNDIKRNITFFEKDSIDAIFIPLYGFDSTYYTIADKGIETFIQTYFESNHPSIKDTTFYRWQRDCPKICVMLKK